ncbi:MAG TPA: YcxB family protein [Gemmatimonadaceae bacterium]
MIFRYKSDSDESIQAVTASARTVTPSWAGLPAYGMTIVAVSLFARLVTHNWREIAGFTFFGLCLLTLFAKLEQRLRWERAIEADPHSTEEHSVEVSDRGLAFWCNHARSELAWEGVRRVQETPKHFLFVCGPFGACAVPKRLMSDSEDGELRSLIRQHSPDQGVHLAHEIGTTAPAA